MNVIEIASWNVNSLRARLEHVTAWLKERKLDVLLLQELKGTEFPSAIFEDAGYHSVAVAQKSYNGVAILSRIPIEIVSKTLFGDEADSHARFLEVIIKDIRIVNIYLPNGNPVGTAKFDYKLAWMDRLKVQMELWLKSEVPTIIGGDFNVIPEDIDCHKPASWIHDALFQPDPVLDTEGCWNSDTRTHFGSCTLIWREHSRSGITFGRRSSLIAASESIIFCYRPTCDSGSRAVRSIRHLAL